MNFRDKTSNYLRGAIYIGNIGKLMISYDGYA